MFMNLVKSSIYIKANTGLWINPLKQINQEILKADVQV